MHTNGILEIKGRSTTVTVAVLFAENKPPDGSAPNDTPLPNTKLTAAKLIEIMQERVQSYLKRKDASKNDVADLMTKFKRLAIKQMLKEMRKSTMEWLDYTIGTEEFMRRGTIIDTPFESKTDQDKRMTDAAMEGV